MLLIAVVLTSALSAQENPTLYLIGDSTMSDKKNPESNPEHGWGQVLPELLTETIKVSNHAVNGRSSKSFITEGRWEAVLKTLKAGDFVFIQFGHNDQKYKDSTRYTNPFTQYRYNLEFQEVYQFRIRSETWTERFLDSLTKRFCTSANSC